MHVWCQGSEEPKSPQETRQIFDKLSTALEICRSKVPEQTDSRTSGLTKGHRSSSRWHTRAWAHAVIRGVESDAVRRHEAYPSFDLEKDLTGADIPDDEFPEEPHVEEAKVPEKIYNAVRLAIMRKIWDIPAKNCFAGHCELAERTKIAIRAASGLKCGICSENKPPKSHLPAEQADTHTEFNQDVRVDLSVLADTNEQVFEFLDIVDLATRFNICFPVPSEKPDDVLSALEMVWIQWAGPLSHQISNMEGEFKRELCVCMETHGIRQYFTASEAPWQNGLVQLGSKMFEREVSWKCEDSPPW